MAGEGFVGGEGDWAEGSVCFGGGEVSGWGVLAGMGKGTEVVV